MFPRLLPAKIVTPHVGVWIEIKNGLTKTDGLKVTPHVGVWIEIAITQPTRADTPVTPHVGVWIEMY